MLNARLSQDDPQRSSVKSGCCNAAYAVHMRDEDDGGVSDNALSATPIR
jgi:hypothetical protein